MPAKAALSAQPTEMTRTANHLHGPESVRRFRSMKQTVWIKAGLCSLMVLLGGHACAQHAPPSSGAEAAPAAKPLRFFVESLVFGVGPGAAVQGASFEEILARSQGPMVTSHLITTDGNKVGTAIVAASGVAPSAPALAAAEPPAASALEVTSAERP